jgi:hypothetical protein
VQLLVVTEQLHVGTTALKALLELDLILDDQSLALVVDLGGEFGRDGMVGSWVLEHQTLVANDAWENLRLFDRPLANIGPVFVALRVLLLRVGDLPSCVPVVGELF